jgi:hypothetical protein
MAKAVAMPVPRPETPELMGRPVQLDRVPELGVQRMGVTRVGLVANTAAPLPVSSVSAAERLAEENEPSELEFPTEVIGPVKLALVTTVAANEPVPLPVTPPVRVMVWSPVFVPLRLLPVTVPLAAIDVAVAAPSAGVTRVGDVANTSEPDPVSSLTAARRFAVDGVPRKVATPDPRLVKPVPPFATATGEVSENTDPVSVSPVPAVNVPAPEN